MQTWLFAVPRLRAMVGANALLGETLRVVLRNLARQVGRWSLAPLTEAYPTADANDPLRAHDDPASDRWAAELRSFARRRCGCEAGKVRPRPRKQR